MLALKNLAWPRNPAADAVPARFWLTPSYCPSREACATLAICSQVANQTPGFDFM